MTDTQKKLQDELMEVIYKGRYTYEDTIRILRGLADAYSRDSQKRPVYQDVYVKQHRAVEEENTAPCWITERREVLDSLTLQQIRKLECAKVAALLQVPLSDATRYHDTLLKQALQLEADGLTSFPAEKEHPGP